MYAFQNENSHEFVGNDGTYAANFDISGRRATLNQASLEMLGSSSQLSRIFSSKDTYCEGQLDGPWTSYWFVSYLLRLANGHHERDAYFAGFALLSGFQTGGGKGDSQEGSEDGDKAHIENP